MNYDEHVKKRLEDLRAELREVASELTKLRREQRGCKRNLDLVVSSAYCPLCLQPLSLEYKYEYSDKVAAIFRDIEKRIALAAEKQASLEHEIRSLEEALGGAGGG